MFQLTDLESKLSMATEAAKLRSQFYPTPLEDLE
jgi:hypothetical protein